MNALFAKFKNNLNGFWIFFIAIFLFNFFVVLAPILKLFKYDEVADGIYFGFSFTCHQLNSRSLCLFNNSIEDCTTNSSKLEYIKTNTVVKENKIGYKLAVCARDVGIYFSMLLGTIVWGFINKKDLKNIDQPPLLFFILSLIPIGIDGLGQLMGLWESSNQIRLISGFIAGFACVFYIIPLINRILD
ncbi:MAG: DUF2085 domain-containing protein [Candidatus Anstonellaceae archaeon]